MGFVVGAEYREESARSPPEPLTQLGLATGNITPETRGAFDVVEAFAELRIPLLADLPFAKSLDLNLAGRVSDYSTVGSTTAWAASVEYLPTEWLKLRSQYAVAVRAPNINELFNPGSQTFPQVGDPCEGVTLSGGQAAFVNAQVRYDVSERISVYAGVDNLFDEYMFVAGTNGDIGQSTGWTTFPEVYDGLGRRFYGGFRFSF
nr:TonB-dependent receptor [Brevundimonas sp. 357]